MRLHVAQPAPGQRDPEAAPAAEVSIEFAEGEPLHATGRSRVSIDCGDRAGRAMSALSVRNALSFQTLVVDALYGEESGIWRALPLATETASGVPLDIWRDAPASNIVDVGRRG